MMFLFLTTLYCVAAGSEGYLYGNGVVRNVKGNTPDPYVFVGHNLSLWCNLTLTDVDANSRLLYFTKGNNELIPTDFITIVNTRTIQLNYPVVSFNDEGNYVCKLNSSRPRVVGNQFVTVEYETRSAKNVHCLVYNWENMTCSWELGISYNHMDHIQVQLIWAIMDGQFDCPHMSPQKNSCSWKKHDGLDSFKSQQTYHMLVLVKNKKDPQETEKKTKPYRINTALIVKPAPVKNLHISFENTTCARINWEHSSFYGKYYEIIYSSQWNDKTILRTTDDTSILICNLTPYTMYTFRVRCKPDMEGYWSEVAEFLNRTPEDVPAGAPLLKPGSYTEYPCSTEGCREVVIYWQPMNPQQKNGEIVEYVMNIQSINSNGLSEPPYSRHILKERNSVKLTLESLKNYQINLAAATNGGISKNFSSFYISSHNRNLPEPKQFVVEAEEKQVTNMHFSWREPVVTDDSLSIISYTLYWCEGSVLRTECDGDMNWISLPAHQTNYEINDFARDYDEYMFGISVNVLRRDGMTISSGLQWSDCTYKADAVPKLPPENVQVIIVEQDVRIDWNAYNCLESRGYVINYLIRYCVLDADNICIGEQLKRTDGDAVKYTLEGLELEKKYYITVSPLTRVGEGPSSSPLFISIPFTGTHRETIIGLSVAGVVGFVFVCVGLYYTCKKFFKFKKKCDVPEMDFGNLPDLPKGDSFRGSTNSCYRSKYTGYAEIESTTNTFLPGYNYSPNQKRSLYKGDKPRECTSSTRSLLHISDDNSEMSEQNKGNNNISHGKDSGISNAVTGSSEHDQTDHDYEDIDEVVSKAEELGKITKQKKKKCDLVAPGLTNDIQLIVNPLLLQRDKMSHMNISEHSLPMRDDSKITNTPYVDDIMEVITNNKLAGANTRFKSADCVAEPSNSSETSNVSDISPYSRFGSSGKLVSNSNSSGSHYMPQNIVGPMPVSPTPYGFRNIIDSGEKSSYLIQSFHDQLTLQRPDRRIPDLKPAPSGQYYTLEQVNEQSSSSSSSSSPQSSASSAELENNSAQHRPQHTDYSGSSSGISSFSNSEGSVQTEVYIPTKEVIRKLPKAFFKDRVHQNHMPLTHL